MPSHENAHPSAFELGIPTSRFRTSLVDDAQVQTSSDVLIPRDLVGTDQFTLSRVKAAFFSNRNIDRLQTAMIAAVSQQGHEISKQSETELVLLMKHVYNSDGNRVSNVAAEVTRLNDLVLKFSVPKIISNLQMYHYYLNTLNRNPVNALPLPMSTSVRNEDPLRDPYASPVDGQRKFVAREPTLFPMVTRFGW